MRKARIIAVCLSVFLVAQASEAIQYVTINGRRIPYLALGCPIVEGNRIEDPWCNPPVTTTTEEGGRPSERTSEGDSSNNLPESGPGYREFDLDPLTYGADQQGNSCGFSSGRAKLDIGTKLFIGHGNELSSGIKIIPKVTGGILNEMVPYLEKLSKAASLEEIEDHGAHINQKISAIRYYLRLGSITIGIIPNNLRVELKDGIGKLAQILRNVEVASDQVAQAAQEIINRWTQFDNEQREQLQRLEEILNRDWNSSTLNQVNFSRSLDSAVSSSRGQLYQLLKGNCINEETFHLVEGPLSFAQADNHASEWFGNEGQVFLAKSFAKIALEKIRGTGRIIQGIKDGTLQNIPNSIDAIETMVIQGLSRFFASMPRLQNKTQEQVAQDTANYLRSYYGPDAIPHPGRGDDINSLIFQSILSERTNEAEVLKHAFWTMPNGPAHIGEYVRIMGELPEIREILPVVRLGVEAGMELFNNPPPQPPENPPQQPVVQAPISMENPLHDHRSAGRRVIDAIPDVEGPYRFIYNGAEHAANQRLYNDLFKITPMEGRGIARDIGLLAAQEADVSFARGSLEIGSFYQELGTAFLDIAVGLDPVTGFGRSAYELFTGNNLVTGDALSGFERSFAFLGVVTAGSASSIVHASEVVLRLANRLGGSAARGIEHAVETGQRLYNRANRAAASATALRNSRGTATMSRELGRGDTILRGTNANAGLIPHSIGETLSGRSYGSFSEFRRDFWRTMAESPHANEFGSLHPENMTRMRSGRAPLAHQSQHVGSNRTFNLHHLEEIQHGGSVYDMGNLVIASPRYHTRVYHQ